MDCSFMACGGDFDGMPEFETERTHTARKLHKCLECRMAIQPGQKYTRRSGKFDGSLYDDCFCGPCEEIRSAFTESGYNEGVAYGELWGSLTENFRDLTTGCFERLQTVAAKQLLRDRWMKWKGLSTR